MLLVTDVVVMCIEIIFVSHYVITSSQSAKSVLSPHSLLNLVQRCLSA